MKRDFKTDVENRMYKNKDEISSLIPYLYEGVAYALDLNAEPLLRAYIVSAIIAYQERNHNVAFEDILTSRDLADLSDENSRSQIEIIRYIVVEEAYTTAQIVANYHSWNFGNENKGLARQLFTASMMRLYTSFKAAVSLLNNGFFVEVIPVFRLILEQLAWGCYLLDETDEAKISENKVHENIGYLKKALNDDRFGRLYGYLSDEAHLKPKEIGKYLEVKEGENSIGIRDRSGKECREETTRLLLLLEAYGQVVWIGMNHFGFPEVEESYFRDWYETQNTLEECLKMALAGENCSDCADQHAPKVKCRFTRS